MTVQATYAKIVKNDYARQGVHSISHPVTQNEESVADLTGVVTKTNAH
jgi:hypothetical protein